MQKNVPKYTPSWIATVTLWAETSKRDVSYALCNDRRTLLWFANQRAVEYHPTLARVDRPDRMTHLVLDLDHVTPAEFTIHNAAQLACERPSWNDLLPKSQRLPATLIDAGTAIPLGRVQAMHEGKRRARATRDTR